MGRRLRYATRSRMASAFKKPKNWKSPHGQANDGNYAHLLSGNLLYDPGVELFVGNTAESWSIHDWNTRTGEDHFTIPVYDGACAYFQRHPSGDCVAYKDQAQWVGIGTYDVSGDLDDSAWHVTRLDPYLGSFSLVWWRWSKGPGGNPQTLLVLSPGLDGYSARVDGGDLITWSVKARTFPALGTTEWGNDNTVGSSGGPRLNMQLWYYNQAGTLVHGGQGGNQTINASQTYGSFTLQTSAPSGSYFLRAMVGFDSSSAPSFTRDPIVLVDSGVLSVE